jgi:hypothetical protein
MLSAVEQKVVVGQERESKVLTSIEVGVDQVEPL